MRDEPASPSIVQLLLGFLSVGMYGFGGVLPWARRMIVEQKRWLGASEFTDMLGLCQFLPGGDIMNVTIALVQRGLRPVTAGPVTAGPVTAGLLMASAALMIRTTLVQWGTAAVTMAATLLFMFTRIHPLLVLATTAALGASAILT